MPIYHGEQKEQNVKGDQQSQVGIELNTPYVKGARLTNIGGVWYVRDGATNSDPAEVSGYYRPVFCCRGFCVNVAGNVKVDMPESVNLITSSIVGVDRRIRVTAVILDADTTATDITLWK